MRFLFLLFCISYSSLVAAQIDSGSDIDFKESNFEKAFLAGAKTVSGANTALNKEGLNYRPHLKSTSHAWSVCSTSSPESKVCQQATVGFTTGQDHCGKFALVEVLAQSPSQWVLTTANTPFRIQVEDYFEPALIKLQKSGVMMHGWAVPDKFSAAYISPDLRTVVLKAGFLPSVYLQIEETGRTRFIGKPQKFIPLTDKDTQEVKSLDGTKYEIALPKKCS